MNSRKCYFSKIKIEMICLLCFILKLLLLQKKAKPARELIYCRKLHDHKPGT